jgi:hypothetical protein
MSQQQIKKQRKYLEMSGIHKEDIKINSHDKRS